MADTQEQANGSDRDSGSSTGSSRSGGSAVATRTVPTRPRVDRLPQFNVILHNDDVNDMVYVVECIVSLVSLDAKAAILRTIEAHTTGLALLVTTHRERAELMAEQFASKQLTVTIEPAT